TPAARTPGGSKPPHPRVQGCNKENEAQLKGTPMSGALQTPPCPQRTFSMASVASTYSEFVRVLVNTESVQSRSVWTLKAGTNPCLTASFCSDKYSSCMRFEEDMKRDHFMDL
ncbi:hypothetical protein ILYODFUR_036677, partial [Ilyodon furcidens]